MSFKQSKMSPLRRLKPYIVATVLGALVSLPILLLLALSLYILQLPTEWAGVMSLFALGGGCLCSGVILGKKLRRKGIIIGARAGLILCALCLFGAVLTGGLDGTQAFIKVTVSVLTGCTGGVLGVNSREKL